MRKRIVDQHQQMHLNFLASLGLLPLRLMAGLAMLLHGLPKIHHATTWMDGLGLAPVPGALQAVAAWIEVLGGAAWILGLATPYASLAVFAVMSVAVIERVQAGQPFVIEVGASLPADKSFESAALYVCVALVLLTVGPGGFSLDHRLNEMRKKSRATKAD
jgi:putative oxidoreductase